MRKKTALKLVLLAVISGLIMFGRSQGEVLQEEYVPKVIIEGKWGTGPGEFGELPHDSDISSFTLIVDGKSNIYILDDMNKRVEMFDNSGKYLKQFLYPYGNGEEIGVDDLGNLHVLLYGRFDEKLYLSWNDYEFNIIDGKLKEKRELAGQPQWLFGGKESPAFDIFKPKKKIINKGRTYEIIVKETEIPQKTIFDYWLSIEGKIIKLAPSGNYDDYFIDKDHVRFIGVDKKNNIYVELSAGIESEHSKSKGVHEIQKYNMDGQLIAIIPILSTVKPPIAVWNNRIGVNKEGNLYQLDGLDGSNKKRNKGIKVIKWQKKD